MQELIGFDAAQVAAALLTALVAAYVRGLAGFGMAILLVPVLALAMTPMEAVLVTNGVSVLLGMSEFRTLLRHAEGSAWRIIAWAIPAIPAGLWLLALTPPGVARLTLTLIALAAFLVVLLPPRGAERPGHLHTGATGAATGLLTGFAGMPGPPVVPYYVGRAIPRATAKSSMLIIFTASSLASLISGAALGLLTWHYLSLSALLLPAVLIGNRLGSYSFGKIADRTWRLFVAAVLGTTALVALGKVVLA